MSIRNMFTKTKEEKQEPLSDNKIANHFLAAKCLSLDSQSNDIDINELQDNCYLNITASEKIDPTIIKEQIDSILKKLIELDKVGKKINVAIHIPNREYLKQIDLANIKFKNINLYISSYNGYYTANEIISEEEILNKMVEEINSANLSPYEKYIAVYNIVAGYKEYNEPKNWAYSSESHNLKSALNSDYIVCNGYSMLLIALLEKVGIKAKEYGVTVRGRINDDNIPTISSNNNLNGKDQNHSRVIVNLDDDFYKVHGIYVADPTWDNNLSEEFLNHSTITFRKNTTSISMFNLTVEDLIFDVKSFEEFNEHINYLFNHSKMLPETNQTFDNEDTLDIDLSIMKQDKISHDEIEKFRKIVDVINNTLSSIDKNFHDIFKKYSFNRKKDFEDFLTEVGHYIVSRTNNEVNLVTISGAYVFSLEKMGYIDKNTIRENIYKTLNKLVANETRNFPYLTNEDDHTPVEIDKKIL